MPLTRVFPDQTDEAPLGYYRRLAEENSFSGWTELARAAEISVSPSGLMGNPAHLARVLGLDVKWTKRVAERDKVMRPYGRYLRTEHDAVCTFCLRESAHIRTSWEHMYVVACHHHKVLLIDRCPRCSAALSKRRPRIAFCDCGYDLRSWKAEDASGAAVWTAMLLSGADARAHWPGPKLRRAPILPASEIISTLCELKDPNARGGRRNASRPEWVCDAAIFLGALAPLLHDWPTGFRGHVLARLTAADSAARTLNSALGLWYQRLKRSALSYPGEPFVTEIMQVARENFAGLIGLDAAGTQGLTANKPISAREAAERLGIGRDALIASIKRGEVTASARQFGKRRLAYQLHPRDVERLCVQRSDWIERGTAAQLLGVPESVLDRLVDVGAVVADAGARADIKKGAPYSRSSIQRFISLMREAAGASHSPPFTEPTVELRRLTSRRVGDHSALRTAFQAIADGKLRPIGPAPDCELGSLRFLRSEVQALFGSVGADAGLTIEQVSRITGWKYDSISHWIDLGLLEHDSVVLRGQAAKIVMPEHLLRFRLHYVPLADLARVLDTRSSALTRRYPNLPLVGAQLLPSGARRGALVPNRELYALALSALEAAPH